MASEWLTPVLLRQLFKGAAFESMAGEGLGCPAESIDVLNVFIDEGVERVDFEKEEEVLLPMLAQAEADLVGLLKEITSEAQKLEQAGVSVELIESAMGAFCPKWPWC